MKPATFVRWFSRIMALPIAWFVAVAPASSAMPAQDQSSGIPGRSRLEPDRLMILQSLLGQDLVPLDRIRTHGTPSLLALPKLAGPNDPIGSPPPPPP
jgi:hypothetical protein